jgi:ankyrin repeat protein
MKKLVLKKVMLSLTMMSVMCAVSTISAFGQTKAESDPTVEASKTGANAAKAFLEKLPGATPVTDAENKAGLFIEDVIKSDSDYIVNYKCTNNIIWGSNDNRAILMTQIYFIDPEKYENTYQPFTIKENGSLSFSFKEGDEIGFPIRRITFEPPSKVMYMYFEGIGSNVSRELQTVPLFFTIVLGDNPYVYEEKPRHAGNLFADVNAADKDGNTALMIASREGHTETVKALLEKGADVNATNKNGNTALILASQLDHTETVKALLEKGADVNATNMAGETPLIWASLKGHTEIVKALLEKGAEVNAKAKNGWTALIYASANGHTEMVKALLEKGAEVNAKTKNGRTALMIASGKGYTKIVKLLKAHGAKRK